MCRAAAQAAAQSELGQCPDMRTKRKATTVPRRSRRTGLFGAWLEPHPRGLGVSSCGSSRSSKRAWSVPGSEDEEEGDDGAAAQQTHRFVRGVAGAMPQGARCVELRQKPQLEVSLRRRSVPTSSCLRLVEGGTDRRGGRAACLASSLRPHCSPRDLLPRWPAPFEAFKNRRDGVPCRAVAWRGVACPSPLFSGPAGKKPSRVDRVYLSVPPLSTITLPLKKSPLGTRKLLCKYGSHRRHLGPCAC